MEKNLAKSGLAFVACFLVSQASLALAQTNSAIQPSAATINYNNVQWSQISSNEVTAIVKNADPSQIPTNAWGVILKKVNWFQLPANVHNYVDENVDWSLVPSNILAYYNQPAEWPDSPHKQATLKRCAEMVRSSVDTNWLAMIANKLTNQPAVFQFTNRLKDGSETVMLVTNADIILYFEGFSARLLVCLDEYAGYLTSPKLKAEYGAGYQGEMPSPLEKDRTIYFGFHSIEGPIRTFVIHGGARDGSAGGVAAVFYLNGKLCHLSFFTPHNMHDEDTHFVENGQLRHLDWLVNDKFAIFLDLDESGNPHISGQFLSKPNRPHLK